jgi:hypothetical protein
MHGLDVFVGARTVHLEIFVTPSGHPPTATLSIAKHLLEFRT